VKKSQIQAKLYHGYFWPSHSRSNARIKPPYLMAKGRKSRCD